MRASPHGAHRAPTVHRLCGFKLGRYQKQYQKKDNGCLYDRPRGMTRASRLRIGCSLAQSVMHKKSVMEEGGQSGQAAEEVESDAEVRRPC